MTCVACQAAEVGPGYVYRKGCKGCSARQIARGPDFHRCRLAGKQDSKYREVLASHGVTHADAVAAAEADRAGATA